MVNAYLFTKSLQAVQKTRPEVLEKWPVNLFQAVFGAGIDTDVQLSNWYQTPGNNRTNGQDDPG